MTSLPKGQILIVDDSPSNLLILSAMLTKQGYAVSKAKTGKQAIEMLREFQPDLILLDITMPDIDGYEVCLLLKSEKVEIASIPIIFISALEAENDKVKAFDVGGVDYITKPFKIKEVLARVENQLSLYRLQKQLTEKNLQLQKEIYDRLCAEEALRISEAKEREKAIQLAKTLQELKQTQIQLIQTEKMSSLGQLVAGIAHEINNPVNFIHGNLQPAQEYVRDLLDLIEIYQKEYPNPAPIIQKTIEEIDFDFIVPDLQKLLNSMKVGSDRIREIVISLRNFSRLDEAEFKPVDLHEGLENTLMILQHRLKAKFNHGAINIVKNYGELPMIPCYGSQINQVFMNLLNNAIDALEMRLDEQEQDSSYQPTISIETQQVNALDSSQSNHILIRIADNGMGMNKEVAGQLFDPFFTTKPVGKGTGLGLSISYQIIVEKHGGEIICNSSPGKGAEFLIKIPYN